MNVICDVTYVKVYDIVCSSYDIKGKNNDVTYYITYQLVCDIITWGIWHHKGYDVIACDIIGHDLWCHIMQWLWCHIPCQCVMTSQKNLWHHTWSTNQMLWNADAQYISAVCAFVSNYSEESHSRFAKASHGLGSLQSIPILCDLMGVSTFRLSCWSEIAKGHLDLQNSGVWWQINAREVGYDNFLLALLRFRGCVLCHANLWTSLRYICRHD